MKNKSLKLILIVVASLIGLVALLNIGFNLWLKYGLPDYIKKNTDYAVHYQGLNVNVFTGNITADSLTIKTTTQNNEKFRLEGSIGELQISRLGLYDALTSKKINLSQLQLVRPQLNIQLPKPKSNPPSESWRWHLGHIVIKDADLNIVKHYQQPLLTTKALNIDINNLKTERDHSKKLPFSFDDYHLSGKAIDFQPDEVYHFSADSFIKDDADDLHIQNFKLKPLITYAEFIKRFPKKRNLFDVEAKKLTFRTLKLKNEKLSLEHVRFTEPFVKIHTTNAKPEKKEQSFTYEVELDKVSIDCGQLEILKPNSKPLFTTKQLDMQVSKIYMNEASAKGNIPFNYETFNINAQSLAYYAPTQRFAVKSFLADSKNVNLKQLSVKPTGTSPTQPNLDIDVDRLDIKVNRWNFVNNQLKLDIKHILANRLDADIKAPTKAQNKDLDFKGIAFPLKVGKIAVNQANIKFEKNNQPLDIRQLAFSVNDVELNENTLKHNLPVKVGTFKMDLKSVDYRPSRFYRLRTQQISMDNRSLSVNQLTFKPTVSRSQFIRMIPVEEDLYSVSVKQITANGDWNLLTTAQPYINANQVVINQIDTNIFRSTIPKDDTSKRDFYATKLRKIKIPLYIKQTLIKNATLVYEEDTETSNGAGKLAFDQFNATIQHINSGKMKGKPTTVMAEVNTRFMNASPLYAQWRFDVLNRQDAFNIRGYLSQLPANRINPFLIPYLKIKAEGNIERLDFNFNGNTYAQTGTMKMKHRDLKIAFVDERGKEKHRLLSGIINWVVSNDSKPYPETVEIGTVEREPDKSFFNFFWKGLQAGLKKILL